MNKFSLKVKEQSESKLAYDSYCPSCGGSGMDQNTGGHCLYCR